MRNDSDIMDIVEYKQDVIDQADAEEKGPSQAEIHLGGVINVVEPIDLGTFFGLSAIMPGSPLLATLGRYLLFPVSVFCELARVILGWRAALNIPLSEERSIERNEMLGQMVIDTLMAVSMGVAYVGGFFWTATLSPLIFTGISTLGLVVGAFNAVDSYNKAEGQKAERQLLHDLRDKEFDPKKRAALNTKIAQTRVDEKMYRAKAKIGAITFALNGLGLAAMVGVMLVGLPAVGILGVASGLVAAAIMGKKYYDDCQAAKKNADRPRHRVEAIRDEGDEVRSEKTTTAGLFERLGCCFGFRQPKPRHESEHSFFSLHRNSSIEDDEVEYQANNSVDAQSVMRTHAF